MESIIFTSEDLLKVKDNALSSGIGAAQASRLLKLCLFTSGFVGIVSEYLLATLATYLLGDPIIQWPLIISLMLFAMGLGSRMSRYLEKNLLDFFLLIELLISFLCSISAALAYSAAAYTSYTGLIIYALAIFLGFLIGLEIPLVTRINSTFETLSVNISAVMENDYFGALLGGLVFTFVALPWLGLTYTPVALGAINFLVASILLYKISGLVSPRHGIKLLYGVLAMFLMFWSVGVRPVILYGEQSNYRDKIIYSKQTRYQKIVITQWKNHYWLFLDREEQFSSYDDDKYHEPLVHPALKLASSRGNVLILGGGDGLAAREALKYPDVKQITIVDIDPGMTEIAKSHPVLRELNQNALADSRVRVINKDAYQFIMKEADIFDVIIIDLPDPRSLQLARLYSREFYALAGRHLSRGGVVVTQAGSPIYSTKAFISIVKTMESAGFSVLPYHNQVPTLGEWGWVLGIDAGLITGEKLKEIAQRIDFSDVETRFINQEAIVSMVNFGKGILEKKAEIKVNSQADLLIDRYYREGRWDMY